MFIVFKEKQFPRVMKHKETNKLVIVYREECLMPHSEEYVYAFLDNITMTYKDCPSKFEKVKSIITIEQQ